MKKIMKKIMFYFMHLYKYHIYYYYYYYYYYYLIRIIKNEMNYIIINKLINKYIYI
jgi:hypothetical protein